MNMLRISALLLATSLCLTSPALAQDEPAEGDEKPAEGDCVEHGLVFDDVVKSLEEDFQIKSMKPWKLKSVVVAECTTTPGEVPLTLTWWTDESSSRTLELIYQLEFTIPYSVEEKATVKQDKPLSKLRGDLRKSIREAEKNKILKEIKKAEPEMGAVLHTDGTIDFLVPAWSDAPVVKWSGDHIDTMTVPSSVEFTEPKLIGFKAAATALEEGKTCELPDQYTVQIDPDARLWTFTFKGKKPCKGNWKVEMGTDGTVKSEKL